MRILCWSVVFLNIFILYIYFSDESKEVRDAVETHQKTIENENNGSEKQESTGAK